MALSDDRKKGQGKESPLGDKPAGKTGGEAGKAGNRDVGHALRSVYSRTVNEEIPPELLDILGKLD